MKMKRLFCIPATRTAGISLAVWIAGSCLVSGAEDLLLTGATVHTVSGDTQPDSKVLIRDGKIAGVGPAVSATDVKVVDLKGQHLYPGIIALNSVLGLSEIAAVRSTQDAEEVGDFTPDVQSWISVNPDSELIPVTRANGIALFEPVPSGKVVSGQSGLVLVDGWTTEQTTVKKPIALHLFWPSMELDTAPRERGPNRGKSKSLEDQAKERRTKLRETMEFFQEAKAYSQAKEAAAKGSVAAPQLVPAWEAMLPYVRGELPIIIHADEVRQLRGALNWAGSNQNFKIIIAGGRDAGMLASLFAEKKVPLIYSQTFAQPARDTESYDVHFTTPHKLQEAGVKVIFGLGADSFGAPLSRNLPYSASQAVAFGLPEAEAIKGLTLYPAQIAGVADRYGTIEVGKDATLFASDGDILDLRAQVKHLWVSGREVSLESRHTRLYDKYRNRPRAN